METLHTFLLVLHVAGGMIGLLSGLYNIVNRKGGKVHILIGKIYVAGMFTATLSGTVLAAFGANHFLFLIGIFSFYLAFSGFRTLQHRLKNGQIIYPFVDKLVAGITAVFGSLMLIAGILQPNGISSTAAPLLMVFGAMCLVFSLGDLSLFIGIRKIKDLQHRWFFNHIGRMMGSYISAVTAFLVVNLDNLLPPLVIWLGPTVIGSLLITAFTSFYKRKFASGK
jgi:uncharacterized membrane protein